MFLDAKMKAIRKLAPKLLDANVAESDKIDLRISLLIADIMEKLVGKTDALDDMNYSAKRCLLEQLERIRQEL